MRNRISTISIFLAATVLCAAVFGQATRRRTTPSRAEAQQQGNSTDAGETAEQTPPRGPVNIPQNLMPFLMHPVVQILDGDNNGEISEKEIEQAAASLKKLDRNSDKKITVDEMVPSQWRIPGAGGFAPGANPYGQQLAGGGEESRPSRAGRSRGRNVAADRMLAFDKDKDGRVARDEVSPRFHRLFDGADANNDGVLDAGELEAMGGGGSSRRSTRGSTQESSERGGSARSRR